MGSVPWGLRVGYRPAKRRVSKLRLALLGGVLISVLALKASVETVVVDGVSMAPTLKNGQYLVVSRLDRKPQNGDLVVVDRWMNSKPLVKRVFKTEGQIVNFKDAPTYLTAQERIAGFRVPEGYVYLLGDNSRESEDSRYYGPVPVEYIVGKVVCSPGNPHPR